METVDEPTQAPADKRFVVTGAKSEYFHESYDTPEQALLALSLLVEKGFTTVSVRDGHKDEGW